MGKIGDLWVRLGLKSDDYKKGIDKAKKETKGFGKSFGDIKAVALAAWAAIGAAVAQVSQDIINASNLAGDAWAGATARMKAAYQTFLVDATNDWQTLVKNVSGITGIFNIGKTFRFVKGAFGNAKEAGDAAAEMTRAFDAEFELINSVRLQKEMISGELNELYVKMRDTTLDPSARKAAADRYKALLQPLADAEIAVYTSMMDEAAKAWQAGSAGLLSRQYSTAEITDFFANYGTNPEAMKVKYPELQAVYETRKGDTQNQVLFDTATKLASATNEMSRVDKEMGKVTLSINKQLLEQEQALATMLQNIEQQMDEVLTEDIENAIEAVEDAINGMDLEIPPLKTDALDASLEEMYAKADEYQRQLDQVAQLNQMSMNAMVSSVTNGIQAMTDAMFSIEGADWRSVLAAFIAPLGDTMKQMGELILAEGIAMTAFKKSFTQPGAAIAAGTALIAIGSMVSSGLQSLINGAGSSGGSAMAYGGSGASGTMNYESTLTVEVVGRISGNDIVLSGKKTNDQLGR